MNNKCYPAVFHKAEEGGFWAQFPDFPECLTQGETMEECHKMAAEALALAVVSRLEMGEELPKATALEDVQSEDRIAVMICCEKSE